jgi:ubiquinone/menaquinone biosynthesis C-methylase UbiE
MDERVCPVWIGYLLACPLRRLLQNPESLLRPHIKPGQTVLEIGPGMGFFSLPMARMVGPDGKVVCVDVQPDMLERLQRRAKKAGLADRIETRLCSEASLGIDDLTGEIDFALAFAVVHEVPDPEGLFSQIHRALKPGAFCLVAEPKGHVQREDFGRMLSMVQGHGFDVMDRPHIRGSLTVVLTRGR